MHSSISPILAPLKGCFQRLLRGFGFQMFDCRHHYVEDGLFTYHNARFQQEQSFRSAYGRGVAAGDGVDPRMEWRLHVALWAAARAMRVRGDFVECGVNAGFISSVIMKYLEWNRREKRYFLIDTFNGPVVNQYSSREVQKGRVTIAEEAVKAGAYVTDLDRVRSNFAEWERAVVVQGIVPDVLPDLDVDRIAFLHLDMNCAFPEQQAISLLWDKIGEGGVVLLDDYAYAGCDCQAEALESFAQSKGVSILSIPTGQGLIMK